MESLVKPSAAFWQGKRVLLTGHTGFKGGWLALWLQRLGAEVTGVALAPPVRPNLFEDAAIGARLKASVLADVRDAAAMRAVVERCQPEVVFHLAAQPLVRLSYENPIETYATNVMGTVHLLDAARLVGGVRAFVVVTSDKCYENREWEFAYRENDALGGHDPYSSSKGCAEVVTAAYYRSFFLKHKQTGVASARAGNVIGGGDWSTDRLVPDCMRAFASAKPVQIRNPASTRPWQHVLEPLAGYMLLAQCLWNDTSAYSRAWNFGPSASDTLPVGAIADQLVRHWGPGAAWERPPQAVDAPHEARLLTLDSSLARSHLKWRPCLTVAQATEWSVEWYRRTQREAAQAVTMEQINRYERLAETCL